MRLYLYVLCNMSETRSAGNVVSTDAADAQLLAVLAGMGSRREAEAAYFQPLSGGDDFADAEARGPPTFD